MATVGSIHEIGDFRATPAGAWTTLYAGFPPAGIEEFYIPEDTPGTPEGPQLTPGKPLGFMTYCRNAMREALGGSPSSPAIPATFDMETDDADIPLLEAVSPNFPGDAPCDADSLSGVADTETDGPASAWKKISAALPRTRTRAISEDISAHANKAKEQVSETVHRSLGYVKGTTETALKVPAQMTETAQRGMGYVKGQTDGVLKVPVNMSETAQKSFGYAKDKAESARDKAQTVSAAVTARVTKTTQKGLDMARSLQVRPKAGGA